MFESKSTLKTDVGRMWLRQPALSLWQYMMEDQVDIVCTFKAVRASRPGAVDSLVRPAAERVGGVTDK